MFYLRRSHVSIHHLHFLGITVSTMLPLVIIRGVLFLFGFQVARAGKLNPFKDDPPDAENGGDSSGLNAPTTYSCPGDNAARYTTYSPPLILSKRIFADDIRGGITFELKCGQGTTASRLRNEADCPSLTACADSCAREPACQSCDWNSVSNNCALFKEYIPTRVLQFYSSCRVDKVTNMPSEPPMQM